MITGACIPNLELEKILMSSIHLLFAVVGFPVFLFPDKPALLLSGPRGKSGQFSSPSHIKLWLPTLLKTSRISGGGSWNHLEGTSRVLAMGIQLRTGRYEWDFYPETRSHI